ncbi:MAG: DUF488 domain-containing protein [Nitrospirae bacterium]|nr:DUF488 domain-containing protein [Nitrospirota bacterium]
MLFDRQKKLLALVDALGGEISSMDFQKLLLLYCHDAEESPSYEFVPYKYGAFSFTSYADKRKLIEKGLLADEDREWKLTTEGKAAATPRANGLAFDNFAEKYSGLRGDELVAETYRRYPYYAIRSEIIDRVFADDVAARRSIDAVRPDISKAGLCSIGYEGRSLEDFLNTLIRDGVTLLCDVRRNPLSRKYGFSKVTLSRSCERVGIRYEHLPELGIASEDRKELHTQDDYFALFAVYKHDSLPKQITTLNKIKRWIENGQRVALACYEQLPEHCHRGCVAEALEHQFGTLCAPRHL